MLILMLTYCNYIRIKQLYIWKKMLKKYIWDFIGTFDDGVKPEFIP